MHKFAKPLLAFAGLMAATATPATADSKPTVVLVHGAFADASSWSGVIKELENNGYPVVAVANPLRGVAVDGDYVRRIVSGLKGPVVLVGHSYGGSVISQAADGIANVKSLVFVGAFAPEPGESAAILSSKFPGSTLGPTLAEPVVLPDGGKDLYITASRFHEQFAADLPSEDAKIMAATQRPITEAALSEPVTQAAWQVIPSWFVYGNADKNIPAAALEWMAKRAKSKHTVVVEGASHVVMISNPGKVAAVIEEAAVTH